jgi:hypothetical protein
MSNQYVVAQDWIVSDYDHLSVQSRAYTRTHGCRQIDSPVEVHLIGKWVPAITEAGCQPAGYGLQEGTACNYASLDPGKKSSMPGLICS